MKIRRKVISPSSPFNFYPIGTNDTYVHTTWQTSTTKTAIEALPQRDIWSEGVRFARAAQHSGRNAYSTCTSRQFMVFSVGLAGEYAVLTGYTAQRV